MLSLFNFISPALSLKYLGLCFFSVMGVLQVVAGRRDIEGLSLLPSSLRRWQVPGGIILVVLSYAVFFTITPEVFTPGLAGAELITLFGAGCVLALVFTLGVAGLRPLSLPPSPPPDEVIALPRAEGHIYRAEEESTKALCLIPDPQEPLFLNWLAHRLARDGFTTLVLCWQDSPHFEGCLGASALAVEHLVSKERAKAVALVGHRLGGDVAIRLTGEDEDVRAVVAIAPFLRGENLKPGLLWLEETSFLRALRRIKYKAGILKKLDILAHLRELEGRPCLIVQGKEMAVLEHPGVEVKILADERPWEMAWSTRVATLIAGWLRERV